MPKFRLPPDQRVELIATIAATTSAHKQMCEDEYLIQRASRLVELAEATESKTTQSQAKPVGTWNGEGNKSATV